MTLVTDSPNTVKRRNSSIELLRILAMLMIIARHYVGANAFSVAAQPFSKRKIFLESFVYPSGKVGVVLFFFISAYFLCATNTTIVSNLRRIWILEREILFWSIVLCCLTFIVDNNKITPALILQSIFPTLTGLWWYPTSYCIFLLLLPFLTAGLRAAGQIAHKRLCIMLVVLYFCIVGFLSIFVINYTPITLNIATNSVTVFLLYFPLVTYYRWYVPPLKRTTSLICIAIGYLILCFSSVVSGLFFQNTNSYLTLQTYLGSTEYMLPIALISIGLFTLFQNLHFSSSAINFIAGRIFAVYLIHLYPPINNFLWQNLFNMKPIWNSSHFWISSALIILIIFVICVAADSLRYCLFKVFFDRNKGKTFDILIHWIKKNSKSK